MKISVTTLTPEAKKKQVSLEDKATIKKVREKLGLSSQTFVVKLNDRIAHPETVLKDGDRVEFIGVIYGG
ncbi:MAG: sulfur carrier protein ThiS [Candidatus Micrarchaeota archaeon]